MPATKLPKEQINAADVTSFQESSVTLPLTGNGTSGTPLDLLLSTDANNAIVLGGDSGLFHTNVLDNNVALQAKDSGGTLRSLLTLNASNQAVLNSHAQPFVLQFAAVDSWSLTASDIVNVFGTSLRIRLNTSDGSDTGSVVIGAASAFAGNRTAVTEHFGNEHATNPGSYQIRAGNVTGAEVSIHTGAGSPKRWKWDLAGNLLAETDNANKIGDTAGSRPSEVNTVLIRAQSEEIVANSITSDETNFSVQTTDATLTTIASIPLSDNTTYQVRANVVGRFASTTDKGVAGHVDFHVYRNNAGSATLIGTPTPVSDDYGTSGYTFSVAVSGNNLLIQVTGAVAETVNWAANVRKVRVS